MIRHNNFSTVASFHCRAARWINTLNPQRSNLQYSYAATSPGNEKIQLPQRQEWTLQACKTHPAFPQYQATHSLRMEGKYIGIYILRPGFYEYKLPAARHRHLSLFFPPV